MLENTEKNYFKNIFSENQPAIVYADDYLNKLTGEKIERECKNKLAQGYKTIILNFKETELVNSVGVSFLLGVIDSAESFGAKVIFSDLNDETVELFEMLGITKHAGILN